MHLDLLSFIRILPHVNSTCVRTVVPGLSPYSWRHHMDTTNAIIAPSSRRPRGSTHDYWVSVCFLVSLPVSWLNSCQHFSCLLFFRNIFMPFHHFLFSLPRHQKCELSQDLDFSFLFFLKRAFRGAKSSFFFFADSQKILQSFVLSLVEKKGLFVPFFFLVSDKKKNCRVRGC